MLKYKSQSMTDVERAASKRDRLRDRLSGTRDRGPARGAVPQATTLKRLKLRKGEIVTLPDLPSNAKEAAWLDVVHKLTGITLLKEGTDIGPGSPDEAIELVCERGMPATLRLVQINIEHLRPWTDVVALFLSKPIESVARNEFF